MSTVQKYVGKGNNAPNSSPTVQGARQALDQADNRSGQTWKPFPELESLFEISNDGKVRNIQTGLLVRTRINKGFEVLAAGRKVNGKLYRPAIHRAVALAFVPNPNNYQWAVAIDRNKPITHAANLKWAEKQFSVRTYGNRTKSLAWSWLKPQHDEPKLPVNQEYSRYILDRLCLEGRLSEPERTRAGIVACEDDSMTPQIREGVEFVATPVSPIHYDTLTGKIVAVVVKASRFAFYLGRVVSITADEVVVSRDNTEWSDRTESRSSVASIARVVSVLETSIY